MTARDFCYWLQGKLEIDAVDPAASKALTAAQVDVIQKHLAMVFVHDIDPKAGGPEHQKLLDEIHKAAKAQAPGDGPLVIRC